MRMIALQTLNSQNSRDRYAAIYRAFDRDLTAEGVQSWIAEMRDGGYAPATVNLHLSALKFKATAEKADPGIQEIKGMPIRGTRLGIWLSLDQMRALLERKPGDQLKEIRDRSILSMLLGSAVRRAELVSLQHSHLVVLDGRPCLGDILGKGMRRRSVPLPAWTWEHLNEWLDAAGIKEGFLWRRLYRRQVMEEGLSADHIHSLVAAAGRRIGLAKLGPHDLRRTFAQRARAGKADIEQIGVVLGHASIRTTEKYLGTSLNLESPACDAIGF